MICLIALVVFSVMGIFSVKYRQLSAKAFDCVFRRMTLRPCQSGLDRQVKTSLIGFFSRKNIMLARFVARYFEILSWAFTILMLLSFVFSIRGVYFYVVYGNCNGANSDDFCVFDALNPNSQTSTCSDPSLHPENKTIVYPGIDDDPLIGQKGAKVTIIEFGCYSCKYTKKAEPVVKDMLKKYDGKILFVYRDFPIPAHLESIERALAANCAKEQLKYWEYHDMLFENQEKNLSKVTLIEYAGNIGLNSSDFAKCIAENRYIEEIEHDFDDGVEAGVYGTPTFFINDKIVVGPKPFEYFRNIIDSELKNKE